jgi:hypothetical protein
MAQFVLLLSLGLLVLWILSPFAVLLASQLPPFRKRLGLDTPSPGPKPTTR